MTGYGQDICYPAYYYNGNKKSIMVKILNQIMN